MSRCKVCESKLRFEIDKQILAGCNFNYLSGWCKDRDFNVSSITLKHHANNHIPNYKKPKKSVKNSIKPIEKKSDIDFNIICFEAYCHSIGLEPDDFKNLDDNLEKIIYGSQKALSLLFFKNSAIVDFKLTQHLNNQSAYPLEQIKGLRSIFEMYAKVTGIEIMINENTAIKLLESLGYTISKNTIDVEVKS
jgi:hypothetical protein